MIVFLKATIMDLIHRGVIDQHYYNKFEKFKKRYKKKLKTMKRL